MNNALTNKEMIKIQASQVAMSLLNDDSNSLCLLVFVWAGNSDAQAADVDYINKFYMSLTLLDQFFV